MLSLKNIDIRKLVINGVFAIFWVFAFLFFNFFYGGANVSKEVSRTFSVIFLFISFVFVDIHYRFVTKPYLGAKHYFRFVLFSIYIFILAFWLNSVLSFVLHLLFWDFENENSIEQSSRISYQIGGVNMVVFGGVALRFMIETLNLHKLKEEKEKQAIEANLKLKEVELNLLKSQINPHFLFNALNCIYGLSLDKSEQTPDVILQLSEILDYMLYKNQNEVLIGEEIKQIENYTAIQKVRFGDSLQLNYTKNIEEDKRIAPLLILTIVENAFKHAKVDSQGKRFVSIDIQGQDNIEVRVCNSSINEVSINETSGLGIKNLKRRLELLYGDRHQLSIDQHRNQFVVQLTLKAILK